MAKTSVFDQFSSIYDSWFETHSHAYKLELQAIRKLLPNSGEGVEIGIGSGKFAVPLGIKTGIEPSEEMSKIARSKGINVIEGIAESLPLEDNSFNFALMVTTICFVDDPLKSFEESFRILKPGGSLIVAFVDKESPIGKRYAENRQKSKFYKEAQFYSTSEILDYLKKALFKNFNIRQTLFENKENIVKEGFGEGSFIVIRALK